MKVIPLKLPNLNLQYTMNKQKIIFVLLAVLLVVPLVSASIISTIGMQGLSFIHPGAAQVVQAVMCVTNPAGLIACAESYVEGKVIGQIYGEAFQQVAKLSPEAAKSISIYNQVKGYIDQGTSIVEELKLNENGKIEEGLISFNEKEYEISDLFPTNTNEEIVVSNSDYDFKQNLLIIKEGGYLKLKNKVDGKEQVLVYENIAKDGFFKFDDRGQIQEARITSTNYASYSFGDNSLLNVGPGTKITYAGGTLTVTPSDESFLYGEISMFGNSTITIKGNLIKCSDCSINRDINVVGGKGIIEVTDKGYYVTSGNINYKRNLINVNAKERAFLIANKGADVSNYPGNWIIQNERDLEIKSGSTGKIGIEFLENHEILNTDNKDSLKIDLSFGNRVMLEKRGDYYSNSGLIPKITHIGSDNGNTIIENGNVKLKLNEVGPVNFEVSPIYDFSEKYQSVAFELESDDFKDGKKFRINSYNQFVILNKNEEELIKYNKYDLPVSVKIEDNSLQNLEQLRQIYPQIFFMGEGGGFDTEEVDPFMIYYTNEWLKENPEALKDIGIITFTDEMTGTNIKKGKGNVRLNVQQIDPSYNYLKEPPKSALTHEYVHVEDGLLRQKEFEFLEYDDEYMGKVEELKNLKSQYDEHKSILKIKIDELNQKRLEYLKKTYSEFQDGEWKEVGEYNSLDAEKKFKVGNKIFELRESGNYFEIEDLKSIEGERTILGKESGKFLESISEKEREMFSAGKSIDRLDYQYTKIIEKSIKDFFGKEENKELLKKIFEEYKGHPQFENSIEFQIMKEKLDDNNIENVNVNLLRELSNFLQEEESGQVLKNSLEAEGLLSDHNLYSLESPISNIISIKDPSINFDGVFPELSAMYSTIPLERKLAMIQSPNPNIKEVYTKLTQLAFDSGKMKVQEYVQIMGTGHCQNDDCSDKLCVEYKLLCCVNHPNSPNC